MYLMSLNYKLKLVNFQLCILHHKFYKKNKILWRVEQDHQSNTWGVRDQTWDLKTAYSLSAKPFPQLPRFSKQQQQTDIGERSIYTEKGVKSSKFFSSQYRNNDSQTRYCSCHLNRVSTVKSQLFAAIKKNEVVSTAVFWMKSEDFKWVR